MMEKYKFDKQNGLWYELHGDYYLPCLVLPDEENKPIGIWGRRHMGYIKQHKRIFYTDLLTSGKMNSYLVDIDEQAKNMFSRLVRQFAEKENVTEQVKAGNQMLWVKLMNNIRNRATETVYNEVIYN